MTHQWPPDSVPVLSRGKHRNPRKGACFMELASFLAGEPWSDHPACTHPLLATLARDVNDHVSDRARREIAGLVPDVIGLDVRDPAIDPLLAREVALTALPIGSAERQRVAAVGLLRCEQALAELEDRPTGRLSSRVQSALDAVPHARDWAHAYCRRDFGRPGGFASRAAPTIVHSAVVGIAEAAVRDPERVLVDLLRRSIADCATWMHRVPPTVAGEQWHEVCALTESRRPRFRARH
jgi:hypothetical protein